jgi:hypothetical protein
MDRPKCNSRPSNLKQPQNILQHLLDIEMGRLETAVRIEKERKIVFPETSIIIHDIERLNAAIKMAKRIAGK